MKSQIDAAKINLVFLGVFPYPHGMAGTKRIQHAIDALQGCPDISLHVIVLHQSADISARFGIYKGTSYQTLLADCSGFKKIALLPILYWKTMLALRQVRREGCTNIIYNYGPMTPENFFALRYGQRIGYKIVFDIVEDYNVAADISQSFLHRMNIMSINMLSSLMTVTASGFIVINAYLESKYRSLTKGHTPIHHRPISVDIDRFHGNGLNKKSTVSLFYAGSFGKKDGIPVLLDAFDKLAAERQNVRLILSGKGTAEDMQAFLDRMGQSPYEDRIEYKGYLDESSYYSLLMAIDIPCMTRIDLPYAHGGFPFKLGEFLASGKPIVASRVSDVDSFLADRDNAMLVRPGSSEDIVEAVEYLLNNPDDAARIGRRGRELASSAFDFRIQGEKLKAFLRRL